MSYFGSPPNSAARLPRGEAVQRHPTNRDIAADQNHRSVARVFECDGDGAIEFHRLEQSAIGVVPPRGFMHQAGIDDQQIARAIELQQLDASPNHRGKRRLDRVVDIIIGIGELGRTEKPEEFGASPARNIFQVVCTLHHVIAIAL